MIIIIIIIILILWLLVLMFLGCKGPNLVPWGICILCIENIILNFFFLTLL